MANMRDLPSGNKKFCTLKEYREITGRSSATASRDISTGKIPHTRIGNSILIPISFFETLETEAYTTAGMSKERIE